LIVLAFLAAYFFRIGKFQSSDFPFLPYFQLALVFVPIFLFLLGWFGLYSLQEKSRSGIFRTCLNACLVGSLLFPLIFFFKREIFFSRLIPLYLWFFSTLFLFLFHALLLSFATAMHRRGAGVIRTLVIGNGRAADRIIRELRLCGSRYQAVAILSPFGGSAKSLHGVEVLGKLDALEKTIERERIDAIIQTEAGEQTINLLTFAEGKYLEFFLSPEVLGAFRRNLISEEVAGMPFLRHRISPLFGWGQLWKRLLDITVSCILLLVFSPAFLLHKLHTVLSATGPGDKTFWKYEFSDAKGWWKFFPELLNVFFGEMSLVGPRPRSPEERRGLKLHEQRRLVVKPGIFGPWQLARLRGEAEDLQREIELDTAYIFGWSFVKDVELLLNSFYQLLFRKTS